MRRTHHVFIDGLWKPTILVNRLMGKKRFMELNRLIPDATQRVLISSFASSKLTG